MNKKIMKIGASKYILLAPKAQRQLACYPELDYMVDNVHPSNKSVKNRQQDIVIGNVAYNHRQSASERDSCLCGCFSIHSASPFSGADTACGVSSPLLLTNG
jgi:hypothetical protein